ncbi:MAG: pseudouridine synthase [Nevskia sp.]|nr:pseudouridine synthase [Nevskia sp.]
MSERIQKVLAEAGVASRRAVEALIAEGRISVNGEPATLGQKIGPADRVKVDGRAVRLSHKPAKTRVLLYKKRVGELVTRDDPEGRKTIFRKLPELDSGRWIAVGRLDLNTSGLLLLTNDGELARRLTHPSFEIEREYAVRVLGEMDDETLQRLRRGVELEDGPAHFDTIVPGENEDGESANQWWRVTLREGRNREVRRLFESQGLQVSRLIRVRYGPIELGRGVKSGGCRELTADEMNRLLTRVGLETERKKATRQVARPKDRR